MWREKRLVFYKNQTTMCSMSIGPLQIILILVLVLILFGAGKLPSVMKDIGKGVRGMKQGLKGEEDSADDAKTLAALQEKSQRGELTDAERAELDKLEQKK